MAALGDVLHGGPVGESEVARVRDVLLFEPPDLNKRLVRFFALLVLASAIATYGLISDAVATIIGAMIVAPLMLPIMGTAFSISIGDRKAIVSSALVMLGGIAVSIAVGYVLAIPFAHSLDPQSNSQIMARTAPRLVDLLAALATGLAGAFAIGRKDVSDTLPGVAIAISLVPPLANVGILLAVHQPSLAAGSMLLFITNCLAILLTGSFVFALMRYPMVVPATASRAARIGANTLVAALVIVIIVPLGVTSISVTRNTLAEQRAAEATRLWLAGSGYRYDTDTTTNDVVRITITGAGTVPPVSALQAALHGRLFGMPVTVEVVPASRQSFTTQ